MKRITHFDMGELRKAERTPQGYLRAPAFVTRTGVFSYRMPDGSIERRLRHPDDVFDPKSLATLAGVPVTDDHPVFKDPSVLLLNAENTHRFMTGYTGDRVDQAEERYVATTVTITDGKLIEETLSGEKCELSCGYTADIEEASGVYEGEPYDVRQRNIVYNHVAVLPRGRAGPNVRVLLDSATAVQVDETTIRNGGDPMLVKITLGGKEFEVAPEVKAALDAHNDAAISSVRAELTKEKDRADKAEAKADGLQSDLDKAKAEAKAHQDAADPAKVRQAVKERRRIEGVAERTLAKETLDKMDDLDDRQLKAEVIKAEAPNVNLDGKSDAYVDARFDHIAETLAGDGKKDADLGKKLHNDRKDGDEVDADAARKRAMDRAQNAWKSKEA